MKRTLCLFCALILAVGICFSAPVTITASAAEAVTSGNCGASTNEGGESSVTWAYDSATTTLTISGTGAMEDYSYDNNPWESYRNEMTNVIISNGVTSIGSYAFYKCTLLASIEIPQSVTTIGESAFFGCTALTSVIIPNSVTTIKEDAFYGCSALETVIIPDSVTTIGEYAFSSCKALVTVKLGKGITTMGGYIFRDCVLLKSVTISEGVTTIERATFWGCSALETVIIPDSVTKIGEFAFRYCKGLETIILPDKLTIIGSGAFDGCSSLVSITIPISVTEISGSAFEGCTSLTSVNAPCSWNEKPLYNFKSGVAVNIQSHTLENNVCIICSENKCGASESDNVVWFFDDGVLYISGTGAMADYDANNTPWKDYKTQIKKVVVGDGVTSIGKDAFYGCTALTEITIPDSVTRLGDKVFWNCTSLTSVTIPESVTTIGDSAFVDCASLTSINVNENNTAYASIDGVLFNKEKTEIIRCPQNKSGEYSIPESVITIGGSAFSSCKALTSVIIPDSVTTIGRSAFWGCSALNLVEIPKNVTTIGESAFTSCSALTSVIIPDNVTTIGALAFWNCASLASVTIPESVTTIGDSAFWNCASLTSINVNENNTAYASIDGVLFNKEKTEIIRCPQNKSGEYSIPESVTIIDSSAFDGCTLLTTVNAPCSWNENPLYTFEDGVDLVIQEHTYENGKCTVANCDNACVHETMTNGVCVTCGGNYCGAKASDKVVWFYDEDTTTLTITGTGAMADYEGDNKPWNSFKSQITNVIINNGVTTIGNYAFGECSNLKSITIPETVTTIGQYAFYGCTKLTSVTIPDSVTTISANALNGCSSLESVTIGNNVTSIGEKAFYGCSALTSVTFGENVENLGNFAFAKCTSLTTITLPEKITSISEQCFDGCTSLKSVTIPDDVTSIGAAAFSNCKNLATVTIPEDVTTIGNNAFSNCTSLTIVTIPNSVKSIGEKVFGGSSNVLLFVDENNNYVQNYATANSINYVVDGSGELEKLTFTPIYKEADNENSEITGYSVTARDKTISGALTIPSKYNGYSVTAIGVEAFYNCDALTSVTIPSSVKTIGDSAFRGCTALTSVTIPSSVKTIDKCAFFECVSLQTVDLTGVSSIGENAFCCCTALNSVVLGDDLKTIGFGAFVDCSSLETIELPEGLTTIDESAFGGCKKLKKVTIPKSVTKIGVGAFEVCTSLAEVEISEGVTTIGKRAFQCCESLTKIVIPKSVTSIDAEAFYNCGNLKYIFFEGTEDSQKELGDALVTNAKIHYGSSTHTFNENYTVDVEPTCTEKGSESQHCKYCDLTQNERDVKENGHTSVNGGTEKVHTKCDVCEEILSATHNPTSKVTKEPTSTEEGVKTYTCECGYSYEEVIPCLVPGEIKAEDAESNSFSATVVDINSIVTKLQLTEEEKALIEQGADMKIVFKLSDIGATINTPEKEAIFKALTNEKIAVFLDIQLVKQIANNSVNVQKLNDLIKVTVELPSEFINKDGNVKRSYSVLRYHDGDETKVTTLNAKFDETTGTLTFETDRFSTYAIVYSDVVVSDGEGVPGTPDPGDGEVSTPENPKDETTPGTPETPKDNVSNDKTDDSVTNDKNDASSETGTNDKNDTSKDDVPKAGVISTTSIWLGAMALSGLGALLVSKKKKED